MGNVEGKKASVNLKLFTLSGLKSSKKFQKKHQLAKKAAPNNSIWSTLTALSERVQLCLEEAFTIAVPFSLSKDPRAFPLVFLSLSIASSLDGYSGFAIHFLFYQGASYDAQGF